jgi:hypothetical protein
VNWEPIADPTASPSANTARQEAFWERYRTVLLSAGVKEGVTVWYRRYAERFIRFLDPLEGVRL